jgi:hypothetical protein
VEGKFVNAVVRATKPATACCAPGFERATLVGRDMIGFVAFDFVLRIVFRSVMDMTFVINDS